jgi:hypothetical protein
MRSWAKCTATWRLVVPWIRVSAKVFFPMGEVGVLGGETLEVIAFERAVFDIVGPFCSPSLRVFHFGLKQNTK